MAVTVKEGVEADDLLANFLANQTNTEKYHSFPVEMTIFPVRKRTHLSNVLPMTQSKCPWRIFDRNGIKENFGVFPAKIFDYLSPWGDSSDYISGIEGIGAKRTEKLVYQFGDIENLLQLYDNISFDKN
jgi:DNA polymerase-1